MNGSNLYYYSQMDKACQNAYHAMKAGITALSPSFSVPRLEGRELADIFFRLRLDCPDIFYAVSFRYRFYPGSDKAEMIPEYLFEKSKVKEHQKAMKARVEKLVRQAQAMAEPDKEQFVHDFACTAVTYDKLKKPYSHEIIGPLGQGVGVCEGIAKTVKILCDSLGIWCIIAVSDANPEKKIKYRHAWNIIRIGGSYYHLDATFDNSLSHNGIIRHDYFNLDDRHIFRDHEPAMYPVPACEDGSRCYYREKKRSFTKMEEVEKRALQAIRKGKPFLFHWRGGSLNRDMLEELLRLLQDAARQKGCFAKVGLNWQQAVFYVEFPTQAEGEAFLMEEANEGERSPS